MLFTKFSVFCRQHVHLTIFLVSITTASFSYADDIITLRDGRTFTGRIISDDDSTIVFEVRRGGGRLTLRYPRSNVVSLVQEERDGVSYCPIPIVGSIGRVSPSGEFVSADAFATALADARKNNPDYVVLIIDSPGGDVQEMKRIIEIIANAGDLQFIAYVRRAISAAAIIASACPTIYMAPDATIGGAVPYTLDSDGMPQNIAEKFRSIKRAEFRSAAILGGHSPLLVLGMMDENLELVLTEENGKPKIINAETGGKGKMIKKSGEILTLTASEAKEYGLSAGTAESLDNVAHLIGVEHWFAVDDQAWYRMINSSKAIRWREKEDLVYAQKLNKWAIEIDAIRNESESLAIELQTIRERRSTAESSLAELIRQRDAELSAARTDWELARQQASASKGQSAYSIAITRSTISELDGRYDRRKLDIANQFKPYISNANDLVSALRATERDLAERIHWLRAKTPKKPLR